MNVQQFQRDVDGLVREYEESGTRTIVVDVGDPGATVDLVDGTAIVVFSDGEQTELEVPADGDVTAFIRNGVLTIEVNDQ